MNCKSWALVLFMTMGLGSCVANFGDWIKKMNNKTRSASDLVNQFIDNAKLEVGTHLIGNQRHLGRGIKSEALDSEKAEKGNILHPIFGSPDSEDGSDIEIVLSDKRTVNKTEIDGDFLVFPPDSEDDFEEDVHLSGQRTVNETVVDEEDDPDVVLEELKFKTSTLTIPTIIGISSAGCVCFLIVVILTILAILRKKNQNNISSSAASHYDRGYGDDEGNGGRGHYDYDRGYFKGDRNNDYPVV